HELLETQGPGTFLEFFRRMGERVTQSKAVKTILNNKRIHEILARAEKLSEHPKLEKLRALVEERRGKMLIVFVQYRDQIRRVVDELNKIDGVRAVQFVGKREGVSQKLQKETIEKFRKGEFNVLVASSIGEEGLDIPSVDCVIFYEPIASEIRSIQRRGRAGRAKAGEVIVLITKGTRDEAYYWVAQKKEKRMRRIVKRMQLGFEGKPARGEKKKKRRVQSKITDYFG
ncbi:MAG: helicase-related protein, partial [Candidatus Micrarchaeota archaeon]